MAVEDTPASEPSPSTSRSTTRPAARPSRSLRNCAQASARRPAERGHEPFASVTRFASQVTADAIEEFLAGVFQDFRLRPLSEGNAGFPSAKKTHGTHSCPARG